MIIVIDPGHGMANRNKGSYDPGAVRPMAGVLKPEETEAGVAMIYGDQLQVELAALGHAAYLTRESATSPASLNSRVALAGKLNAHLLISLHLNAAPVSAKGRAHGHEVLYRTPDSAMIARRVSDAISPYIAPHGAGVIERPRLFVLAYSPSIMIELGFIDSDDDYAVLVDADKREAICAAIAQAVTS